MNRLAIVNVSRRDFLKASAAASIVAGSGLTLGFWLGGAQAQSAAPAGPAPDPNAFVRIGRDNSVTVIAKHLEMGQGTYTGLATLVAEELDASWEQVKVEGAPADAKLYNNLFWGPAQGTGGSSAIANSWEQLRTAGAAARAMLVAAAAKQWNVPEASITIKNGIVTSGARKMTFGQLADAAATMPVPTTVKLKDPKDFVLIGKRAPRKDTRAKSNGTAQFTADVKLPDMLIAVVAHPPKFGARVKSIDSQGVTGVPGVRYVVEIQSGVAVLATGFWVAKKGRDALKVTWDESAALKVSSAGLLAEYKALAASPGKIARSDGDATAAMAGSAKTLDAAYEFPYLAHAAMEPLDCVVKLSKDGCEVWNGEQFQTGDQHAVAKVLGLKPEQVKLHMLYAGGSFDRRANPASDYVVEAAEIAKMLAGQGKYDVPIKLMWTREDDMTGGFYRPAYYHTLKAGLDAAGNVVAWQHRIVGQSILTGTPFEGMTVKDGIDSTSVEGASSLPTRFRTSPWTSIRRRSACRCCGGAASARRTTPTAPRRSSTSWRRLPARIRSPSGGAARRHQRHLAALDLAAKQSGWGTPSRRQRPARSAGAGWPSTNRSTAWSRRSSTSRFRQGIQRRPRRVRRRLRHRRQPGQRARANGGRHRLRPFGRALRQDHTEGRRGRAIELPRLPGAANRRDAEDRSHIVPSTDKPTGSANRASADRTAVANALAAATGERLRMLPLALA